MKTLVLAFQLLSAQQVPGQIDRFCFKDGSCNFLAIRENVVRFIDPGLNREIALGKFVSTSPTLLPKTEAAIRDTRTKNGWRVVISVFLDREEGGRTGLRTRLFSSDGRLRGQFESMAVLSDFYADAPFGDSAEVVAVSSWEEHSYNVDLQIWLLPLKGEPQPLLEAPAARGKFISSRSGHKPGVWIERETYDGVNANTKGFTSEFWAWNSKDASLKPPPKARK